MKWVALTFCSLGLSLIAICAPRAAQESTPHEITLLYAGKDYEAAGRTQVTLGVNGRPFEYESREACRIAITRIRVEVTGARLRCDPVDPRRVR